MRVKAEYLPKARTKQSQNAIYVCMCVYFDFVLLVIFVCSHFIWLNAIGNRSKTHHIFLTAYKNY